MKLKLASKNTRYVTMFWFLIVSFLFGHFLNPLLFFVSLPPVFLSFLGTFVIKEEKWPQVMLSIFFWPFVEPYKI